MALETVFKELKQLLQPYASQMVVLHDKPGAYTLTTSASKDQKDGEWFASTQIKKNYVSYYLMPIYCNPALKEFLSPDLKRRMQGKSCFNFKKVDPVLLEELAVLTAKGLEDFRKAGKVVWDLSNV